MVYKVQSQDGLATMARLRPLIHPSPSSGGYPPLLYLVSNC